jgi:hypothetical protein
MLHRQLASALWQVQILSPRSKPRKVPSGAIRRGLIDPASARKGAAVTAMREPALQSLLLGREPRSSSC